MGIFCNPFAAFFLVGVAAIIQGIRLIVRREVTQNVIQAGVPVTVTYQGRIPFLMGLRLMLIPACIIAGITATFSTNNQIWNSIGFIMAILSGLLIEYFIRQWRDIDAIPR